jgi:endothelin-converting enzyme/putative endopeptidase
VTLGKLCRKKIPAEAKEKAEKMIQNIILATKIVFLTWMSAETKIKTTSKN